MGPASGSAKSAPHKQRKGLHPTGFEETLAQSGELNRDRFSKAGQRRFFLLLDFLHGISKGDLPQNRQQAGKNQIRPCVAIYGRLEGRGGERTPPKP